MWSCQFGYLSGVDDCSNRSRKEHSRGGSAKFVRRARDEFAANLHAKGLRPRHNQRVDDGGALTAHGSRWLSTVRRLVGH